MNTATGEIYKFWERKDEAEKEDGSTLAIDPSRANFMKAIPDKYVETLQGMNRKDRRKWYRKNKHLFKEA